MAIAINGSGTVTGISVGGLPDGIVDRDTLATQAKGSILQVKQTVKTDTASTQSMTHQDAVTVSITPSSSSNKILVMYKIALSSSALNFSATARLVRDSTAIYVGDANGNRIQASSYQFASNGGASDREMNDFNGHFLDSPNTTSAITYKIQFASSYTGYDVYVNRSYTWADANYRASVPSSITVMEIAA
tara:strand:+ start:600 stop:1169 length:570 start_codon:yes stop_codon:yes gene_type:complete